MHTRTGEKDRIFKELLDIGDQDSKAIINQSWCVKKKRYGSLLESQIKYLADQMLKKRCTERLIEELFEECTGRSIKDYFHDFYITEEEIRSSIEKGALIGSHGKDHKRLCREFNDQDTIDSDINHGSDWIDSLKQKDGVPKMFSFPYGCYDQYALKKTMARGFKYIFSTEPTDWNQKVQQVLFQDTTQMI